MANANIEINIAIDKKLRIDLEKCIAENELLLEVLKFYAEFGNWKYLDVMYDKGDKARQILNMVKQK